MKHKPLRKVAQIKLDQSDCAKLITNALTEFELFDVCGRIGSMFGLPHFSIFNTPDSEGRKLSDLGLVSNWPEFLIAEYDKNNLLVHSPIISHIQSSTEPLVFDIEAINKERSDGNAVLAADLFKSYGILNGVLFNVHLANGQLGAVSFSGSGNSLSHDKMVELNYLANLLYSKIFRLRSSDKAPEFDLNKSELNCLRWTSQGKTSGEIATILELSEHTVNHYLTNASHKLGTTNRTHAVSKSIRLKIIS